MAQMSCTSANECGFRLKRSWRSISGGLAAEVHVKLARRGDNLVRVDGD